MSLMSPMFPTLTTLPRRALLALPLAPMLLLAPPTLMPLMAAAPVAAT